jgi:hypothetical protein
MATTICGWFEYRTHQNGDDLGDIGFTWVYHICEVCPKFFGGLKHLELPFFALNIFWRISLSLQLFVRFDPFFFGMKLDMLKFSG